MNTALALLLGFVLLALVGRSIFKACRSVPEAASQADRRMAWLIPVIVAALACTVLVVMRYALA